MKFVPHHRVFPIVALVTVGISIGCAPEIRPTQPEPVAARPEPGSAETSAARAGIAAAKASTVPASGPASEKVEPPFTVEEIRRSVPVGTQWRFRTEFPNATPIERQWTVTAAGHEGVELDVLQVRGDERTTNRTAGRWDDWLRYEVFEQQTPVVTVEEIELPYGRERCTVYTVSRERGTETVTARFSYAHAIPGPPVDVTMTVNGELLTRMTLVEFSRPDE